MDIPLLYLRDKQAFRKEAGAMALAGKPVDVAKGLKEKGAKLIHFVDLDALNGMNKNADVYGNLTFFINVEVETAPREEIVTKLLSLHCRVVLPPDADVTRYREKRLLVARIPPGYRGDAAGFHDVILEEGDEATAERFRSLGKRVIIFEKDEGKMKGPVWGVISSS